MVAPFGLSLSYEALCDLRARLLRFAPDSTPASSAKFLYRRLEVCYNRATKEVKLMSAEAQFDSPRAVSDLPDSGPCSFCAAPNSHTKIACNFCGSRLPWTFEGAPRRALDQKFLLPRYRSTTQSALPSPPPEPTPVTMNAPLLMACDLTDAKVIKS